MRDKRTPKDVCGEANGTVASKGDDIFFLLSYRAINCNISHDNERPDLTLSTHVFIAI